MYLAFEATRAEAVFGGESQPASAPPARLVSASSDRKLVVRYTGDAAEPTKRALEASLGLIEVFTARDGTVSVYKVRDPAQLEVALTELTDASNVVGVSVAKADLNGRQHFESPNELTVQFVDSVDDGFCRAELSWLGALFVQAASGARLYHVEFASEADRQRALDALARRREVASVGGRTLGWIDSSQFAVSPAMVSAQVDELAANSAVTAWSFQTEDPLGEHNSSYHEFLARYPGDWAVRWDARTQGPSLLYGPGIRLVNEPLGATAGEHVLDLARNFVRANDTFFRTEPFTLHGTPRFVGNTWLVNLGLMYRGIPLEEHSRVCLGIKDSGGIAAIELESIPATVDGIVATVPAARAIAAAASALPGLAAPMLVSDPSLCILVDDAGAGRLTWRFVARTASLSEPLEAEFFVHARGDGELLRTQNRILRCSRPTVALQPTSIGAASGAQSGLPEANETMKTLSCGNQWYGADVGADIWPGSSSGFPIAVNLPDALVKVIAFSTGSGFTDDFGIANLLANSSDSQCRVQLQSKLEGRWCVVRNAASSTCLVGDDASIQQMVAPSTSSTFYHLGTTEYELAQSTAYYWTTLAHNWSNDRMGGNNGVNLALTANVNICGMPGSAYYSAGQSSINFAKGEAGGCPNMAISDVIGHEYGHAIDFGIGGILDGAYSEGFSDAFAMALTKQPIVGTGGCPSRDGRHVKFWTDLDTDWCASGIHCIGWVYSGFTWKLRELLRARYGETIGDDTADALILGPAAKNPSSIPNAVFWTFVVNDNDFSLNNLTPEYCEIVGAAVSRALPIPKIKPSSLQPVVHYTFNEPDNGRDSAFDGSQSPCPHDEVSGLAQYDLELTPSAGAASFHLSQGSGDDTFVAHHKPDLDLVGLMTCVAWIKPAGNHDNFPGCEWGTIITKGNNYWFQVSENNDGLLFQNEGSGGSCVSVTATIPVDEWTHVAFVRTVGGGPDPTAFARLEGATTVTLYINGQNVASGSSLLPPTSNGWGLSVGHAPYITPQVCEFNGLIDELQIFPAALTGSEISTIYDTQLPLFVP